MRTREQDADADDAPVASTSRKRLGLAGAGALVAGALGGGLVARRLRRGQVPLGGKGDHAGAKETSRPHDGGRPPAETSGRYYTSAADPAGGSVAGTDYEESGEPRPVEVGAGADAVPAAVSEASPRAGLENDSTGAERRRADRPHGGIGLP